MSKNTWQLTTTVMRSTLVAPIHGLGMGDVCPQQATAYAGVFAASVVKRHRDAIQAPTSARTPWSPPVT